MESAKSSRWPWRKKSTLTHVAIASPHQGTHERRSQSLSDTLLTNNTSLLQQHAQIAEEALSESEGGRCMRKKGVEEGGGRSGREVEEVSMVGGKLMKERSGREVEDASIVLSRLEAKIGEAEEKLIAAEVEKSVILSTLHQRDSTLALLFHAKHKAESQLHSFYANMTALLKENSRLKYELHLLHKEHHIRNYTTTTPTPTPTLDHHHHHLSKLPVHSEKEKVFESLESELQVLRSVGGCVEAEANSGDADDVYCSAQSLACAMIGELQHFSRREKGSAGEIESVASSSPLHDPTKTDDLKHQIQLIQAADRKDWRSSYASEGSSTSAIASRFCTSSSEIVKLVKALAHPLLYSTTNTNKSFSDNITSELSESDLQSNIEKLEKAISESGGTSVSFAAVEFLQVLVGVLNRLVKITLYRNAQRDGCSDDCDDQDDDLTAFASVSQNINAALLSPLPTIQDFNQETTPAIGHHKFPTKSENERESPLKGGISIGHPSLNSKHLITPTNSNKSSSSSSKLFHFNSNYIKTAIRSTISKTRSESSATAPSYHHVKSKPPNKLLNRLLSFS